MTNMARKSVDLSKVNHIWLVKQATIWIFLIVWPEQRFKKKEIK
ncbi:hypothetical protein V6Z12_D03G021700 [Gossypium hirsutum]